MSKGVLIAVEGLDGSGKSTQAHLLVEWLRSMGAPVHHTEWNSSPLVASSTKKAKKQKRLKSSQNIRSNPGGQMKLGPRKNMRRFDINY